MTDPDQSGGRGGKSNDGTDGTGGVDTRRDTDDATGTSGRDETAAVTALERLGLSNYEARVFLALQRLGVGTAKEIHKQAGVPRSQVYGAAESLQERGLVEFQRTTPKRYRPVNPEAAQNRLTARLERESECAFEYIKSIRREGAGEESPEEVWSVRGGGPITDRSLDLIEEATERVVFCAAAPELVSDTLQAALVAIAEEGVDVTVVSADPDVRQRFVDGPCRIAEPSAELPVEFTGRMLLVDDRAVLLSVHVDAGAGGAAGETGIWTADTAIADVLVRTLRTGIAAVVGE